MTMQGRYDRLIDRVAERMYAREHAPHNRHRMRRLETASRMQDARIYADSAVWPNGILPAHGSETRQLMEAFRLFEESLPLAEAVTEPDIAGFRRDPQAGADRLGRDSRPGVLAGCPEVK